MTALPEPLPCPKCGRRAVVEAPNVALSEVVWWVGCRSSVCYPNEMCRGATRLDTVATWNAQVKAQRPAT